MLAAGNLGGRIGWAAFSDKFGRKLTFNMFCLGSIPLYLAVPYTVQQVVGTAVSGTHARLYRGRRLLSFDPMLRYPYIILLTTLILFPLPRSYRPGVTIVTCVAS